MRKTTFWLPRSFMNLSSIVIKLSFLPKLKGLLVLQSQNRSISTMKARFSNRGQRFLYHKLHFLGECQFHSQVLFFCIPPCIASVNVNASRLPWQHNIFCCQVKALSSIALHLLLLLLVSSGSISCISHATFITHWNPILQKMSWIS